MNKALVLAAMLFLVGCGGSREPRIVGAQELAIKRVSTSLQMHNRVHVMEQAAFKSAKDREAGALFAQSIKEAKEDAEEDPTITKDQLVDEVLQRVEKHEQNKSLTVMQTNLMKRAVDEANKPAKDAAELLGIVLQFEQAEGFSYTELINTLAPLVPSPMPIPGK